MCIFKVPESKGNAKDIWGEDEVPEGSEFDTTFDPRPQPEYVYDSNNCTKCTFFALLSHLTFNFQYQSNCSCTCFEYVLLWRPKIVALKYSFVDFTCQGWGRCKELFSLKWF
jgi:hypothetical protein